MNGFLSIYDLGDGEPDYEKLGYWFNYRTGIMVSPNIGLQPFQTPNIPYIISGNTASLFKLQKVEIVNGVATIIKTNDLTLAHLKKKEGSNFDRFYFPGTENQATYSIGIYRYYMKIATTVVSKGYIEWVSDPFKITRDICPYPTTGDGDFSNASPNDDFNEDFSK